jgi:MtN3 and saliva related transmembrane protein
MSKPFCNALGPRNVWLENIGASFATGRFLHLIKPNRMHATDTLGLIAGLLTTVAFVPQVVKTWKSKSAKDLSLAMFLLYCFGVFLWTIYGVMINELPVILWNIITLLLAAVILFFKIRFRNQ